MHGIDVTDLWKSIAAIAFSGAALVAVFAFLARSIFLHFLSHDLETHKAKLAADNALALEQFKAELRAVAFEHETRFAGLHERRIRIIAELYKQLVAMDTAFRTLLAPLQVAETEKEEASRQIDALQKAGAFFEYFKGRRIYFDDSLCKLIDTVDETYRKSWNRYASLGRSGAPSGDERQAILAEFMQKMTDLHAEIEKRWRNMLGVSVKDSHTIVKEHSGGLDF